MKEYKKITFRIDMDTYELLQEYAIKQYLTLSALIRKYVDTELTKEILQNDIQ